MIKHNPKISKSILMNRFFILLTFLLFYSNVLIAQDKNYTKHTVLKGENITQIAIKYKVTPYDIYKLNPDSQSGIKENDVILIPIANTISATVAPVVPASKTASNRTHIVKSKETLYSISRDYNVNVDDLKNLNGATLANGLKIGQTIKISEVNGASTPVKKELVVVKEATKEVIEVQPQSPVVSNRSSEKKSFHIVEAKETKFGIAKRYGITVQELEERNPAIIPNLPVGYKLIISGDQTKIETPRSVVEKPKPVVTEIVKDEVVVTQTTRTLTKNGYANYEVKAGETLYSLSQYFGITPEELIQLNPTLKEGVKIDMILKVPGKGTIKVNSGSNSDTTAKYIDLTKTVSNKTKKQLVLLLPFNASKIQSDTLKTIAVRLKKDSFLNMTLDFYSGALMAIDSAKTLGMNVDVKIYDSEESKVSSNVEAIIKNNHVQDADAVIGPFYQQYVEKVADLLNENNVPVISPLSKEIGKSYTNLYQAMPPSDFAKSAMFDFMMSKNGNIIMVSDPKKVTNKDFINTKYPNTKFATLLENGALDVVNIKTLFDKDKINYVVLDSERTGMILSTTNVLLNEMANFQIQLAIIEPNETLDFEEISMKRLTILKMLYPSLTRDNTSVDAVYFENDYKDKNKVFPNQYAVRGFDVTFDTLLRLNQEKTFEASATSDKTEQIESKFEYAKKGKEGFVNKGVYIMEYQDDLSVKQVN